MGRMNSKLLLLLVAVAGLFAGASAWAADKYLVLARFVHLGESIANPAIEVEGGQTLGGTYHLPDNRQYKFVALVRPQGEDRAYVSMQFTYGKIDIQPNLMVELGKETQATIDKVSMTLLVKPVVESTEQGTVAFINQD